MKTRTLAIIAGLPALLSNPAHADFVGLNEEAVGHDLIATDFLGRLHAVFTSPTDQLLAAVGTPDTPMNIMTWGTFYQNPFGTDLAPNQALIDVFPSLAEDTFVTIGKTTSEGDATMLALDWPGFTDSSLNGTNIGWFVTPDQPQSMPVDGRVLIAQFGIITAGDPNTQGNFLIQTIENGIPRQHEVGFVFFLPTPGVLPLLACLGLARTRRRR